MCNIEVLNKLLSKMFGFFCVCVIFKNPMFIFGCQGKRVSVCLSYSTNVVIYFKYGSSKLILGCYAFNVKNLQNTTRSLVVGKFWDYRTAWKPFLANVLLLCCTEMHLIINRSEWNTCVGTSCVLWAVLASRDFYICYYRLITCIILVHCIQMLVCTFYNLLKK